MSALPPEVTVEVGRTLDDLRRVRMAASAWPAVAGDLGKLAKAVEHSDPEAVRRALVPLSQAAFEGKVRGRLAAAGGQAALVVATKSTSALPLVGLVCGVLLVGLGYALGGWIVALGTAVRGLFVFGVAVAGMRTSSERAAARRAALAPTAEPTEPAPRVVVDAIGRIEEALRSPKVDDTPGGEADPASS